MNFQLTLFAAVAICIVSIGDFCWGQSTVIGSGPTADQTPTTLSLKSSPRNNYSVPNSLTPQQQRWESILDQPATGLLKGVDECSELLWRLRELGLPVFLDQTAIDDSLPLDEKLDFQYDGTSLRSILIHALEKANATIVFRDDSISIISIENAEDEIHLETVVYDVSSIASDIDSLRNLAMSMRELIQPNSWDGGTGSGVAQPLFVGGRHLISVCNTYEVHREVQKWLRSLNQMKGHVIPTGKNFSGLSSSTIPSSPSQSKVINPMIGRGFRGVGGFSGGGVF